MSYSGAKDTIQRNVCLILCLNPRQTIYHVIDNWGVYVELFTILASAKKLALIIMITIMHMLRISSARPETKKKIL